MSRNRKLFVTVASILAAFALVAGIKLIQIAAGNASPLGEAMPLNFAPISTSEVQHFIDGDFKQITDVRSLPRPVLAAFTEQGGSRVLMANPGKKFEATDVILDASVPQKRLIFAGVSDNRCFVHFEQGGRAHSYVLAFFTLPSAEKMAPLWQGYCYKPAATIEELHSKLVSGACSQSPYRRH
jgi:hypothetical protein